MGTSDLSVIMGAGMETEEIIPIERETIGKAIVNFRPKKGWKGEYGFDWFRLFDDSYHGDASRKEYYPQLLLGGYGTFKYAISPVPLAIKSSVQLPATLSQRPSVNLAKEDALEFLKDEYRRIKISYPNPPANPHFLHYYTSYLNIYSSSISEEIDMRTSLCIPPHGGNVLNKRSAPTSAELRLAIEVLEDIDKIELEYDEKCFVISNPTLVNTPVKAGEKREMNITITCKSEEKDKKRNGFDTPKEIKAWAYHKNKTLKTLAGKMIVLPNGIKYRMHLDMVYVNVRLDIASTGLTPRLSLASDIVDHIQKSLYQALIDCTIVAGPDLDMSSEPMFKPGVPVAATASSPAKPTDTFVYSYLWNGSTEYSIYSTIDTETTNETLYDFLEQEYVKQYPQYKGYFFLFYINAEALSGNIVLKGQAKKVGELSAILFQGYQHAQDTMNPDAEVGTVTHEILHGLGLHHSFPNQKLEKTPLFKEQKFVFRKSEYVFDPAGTITNRNVATDNIMDYPPATQICTWHWQWKMINKKQI